jgi:uncharacterized membrane-anchored protein
MPLGDGVRKILGAVLAAICLCGSAYAQQPPPLTPEQQQLVAKYKALANSLHPQRGDVGIPAASATLHLDHAYYFLPADEAKRVLTEAWSNPPDSVGNVLGMVFPEGKGFYDDTWAAVVTFDGAGFVSDKQATSAEYDQLIKNVQSQEGDLNAKRKTAGFPAMHLVGWAQPPSYDQSNHTVIWARDLQFGEQTDHALNYDLRVLGRKGVLSLNLVSQMSRLAEIRPAAEQLRRTAAFDPGATFADFKPGVDKATGYGIAGLIGAGLGLAAAKQLGLLALAAVFLKKGFVIVLAVFAGGYRWIRRLFSRRPLASHQRSSPPKP